MLQYTGAVIGYDSEHQEGESETETVERQQERRASRVAPRGRDAEDRTENDTDARCPGDGERGAEHEAAKVATAQDWRRRTHAVELWNTQQARKVQPSNGYGDTYRNL